MKRALPGETYLDGAIERFQGSEDQWRSVEWFELTEPFTVPSTVNGYWYGHHTPAELEELLYP